MSNVKITKFGHSCLIVEHEGVSVLFDPGDLSWQSGLDLKVITKLDVIAITHEHSDHLYVPFVQALQEKFPGVMIDGTPQALDQIKAAQVSIIEDTTGKLKKFIAPHEDLPFRVAGPNNTGFHFSGVMTHPGDSHSFNETMPILAMPMTAPWGSMVTAIDKIVELKPRYVIPIHDWHWRPEALLMFYDWFRTHLKEQAISFLIPVDGEEIELELP